MERLSRDAMLMEVAQIIAQRGTCSRLQVGAVFSRNGRIIATGYNGVPAGLPHCNHDCTCLPDSPPQDWKMRLHDPTCPYAKPCEIAEHAERNGIAFAAKHGLALDESDLHVTHAPCWSCARSVINAGIKTVYFQFEYRMTEGVELLRSAGLEVVGPRLPL